MQITLKDAIKVDHISWLNTAHRFMLICCNSFSLFGFLLICWLSRWAQYNKESRTDFNKAASFPLWSRIKSLL